MVGLAGLKMSVGHVERLDRYPWCGLNPHSKPTVSTRAGVGMATMLVRSERRVAAARAVQLHGDRAVGSLVRGGVRGGEG